MLAVMVLSQHRVSTRDVEAEAEAGSGSAKNPPLPLPHRREEWREKKLVLLSLVEERIGGA